MADGYETLSDFVRDHRSDPVTLAKAITAWQWTSLLPGNHGTTPTSAQSVPDVLNASCGWRDVLMSALFAEINIQSRRVNFYDVPFQTNHTATELLINGRWMFFDPTFGIYFESKSGGLPLSIAAARANWPDVVVKRADLTGWQGQFVDVDMDLATSFAAKSDAFCFQPVALFPDGFAIGGELNSLYFGPDAAYYIGGVNTPIGAGDHRYRERIDSSDRYSWHRQVDTLDADGNLDFRYVRYDDRHYWFTDWDLGNDHPWTSLTTYTSPASRYDYSVTINDDRTKVVADVDQTDSYSWSDKTTYYTSANKADYQIGQFDNGGSWLVDWDVLNAFAWQYFQDTLDADGGALSTYIKFDNGTGRTIDWSAVNVVQGTAGSNDLTGTSAVDLVLGGAGNDRLRGGDEIDRLEGGLGNDTYILTDLQDFVVEKASGGSDTVYSATNYLLGSDLERLYLTNNAMYGTGNSGANVIVGNDANNVLSGGGGRDSLLGLAGNDKIVGGTENDVIEGGLGADMLYGNAGADVLRWRSIGETGTTTSTSDLVKDFSFSAGDRINLKIVDANVHRSGNQAFEFVGTASFDDPGQVRYFRTARETVIVLNVDNDSTAEGIIRLSGHHDPSAKWFVL